MTSFYDCLMEGFVSAASEKEAGYSGADSYGRYDARVRMTWERGELHALETRRYLHGNGEPRRIARFLDDDLFHAEEWNEDGGRQRITSYEGLGEWLWEKIFFRTGQSALWINRDSFLFFGIPEDMTRSIETGTFHPEQMLDIRWEGVREAILEILGAAKLIPELPMAVIDSLGPNRLLKMDWYDQWREPRMDPWYFLELHCTTTGKVSYLRVPPGFSDIMSAIAWTFGIDKDGYQLEVET